MPRSLAASSAIEAQDTTPRTPQSQGKSVTPHGADAYGPKPTCRGAVAASSLAPARAREAGPLKRRGFGAASPMRAKQRSIREDLAAAGLMPAGDHTVAGPGGVSLPATESLGKMRRRARTGPSALDFVHTQGGFRIVSIKGGDEEGGVTSHRGVLHPDEYVDHERLVGLLEDELGFTFDEVHVVYRRGRFFTDEQRELRDQIDARLLALSRAGANMELLGRLLGFKGPKGRWPTALTNAVARARAAELSTTERSSA